MQTVDRKHLTHPMPNVESSPFDKPHSVQLFERGILIRQHAMEFVPQINQPVAHPRVHHAPNAKSLPSIKCAAQKEAILVLSTTLVTSTIHKRDPCCATGFAILIEHEPMN
jgi:hypothetical protein